MLNSDYLEPYMDSRDIQKRIDELELDDTYEYLLTLDEQDELETLLALKEDAENYGWEYGIFFIREDYFVEYTQELVEDCFVPNGVSLNSWPFNCLDWEEVADQLKQDYSEIEIDGITMYWREA